MTAPAAPAPVTTGPATTATPFQAALERQLRREYREARRAFYEAVRDRCEDAPRHRGRDLLNDLDDCSADDDSDTNYAYGWMHGVRTIAGAIGLELPR